MKVAKVIPIVKGNDKQVFTNYRPISLLPQFSKILEKLFYVRLDNFIERHSILSNSQYGFRPNISTSLALLELREEIASALDKKKYYWCFYTLKKAFDTIDHTLLLEKLRHYGVRGVANDWLSSYLENRLQYVSFGDTDSTLRNVIFGVPQGSILGPKLFILYINDICNVSPVLKFILFADDTNIFCSGSDIVQLSIIVSNELDKLSEWFAVNKLSLNLSKTNFMLFTNCRIEQNVNISINNCEIDMVYKTKFLGVVIDSKLNWKDHVAMVKSKLSKSIAIMHKAKHLLDRRSGVIIYFSFFLPYLSYCCEVWGNTYSSNIKHVYKLQKKAVRIVCNADYHHPSNVLFIELHVLKLHDLIELRTAMIMFKAKTGCLPVNLQTLFHMSLERIHDTRNSKNIRQVFARTNKQANCITVHGIQLWNTIQDRIRRSHNIHTFKKRFSKKLHSRYTLLM